MPPDDDATRPSSSAAAGSLDGASSAAAELAARAADASSEAEQTAEQRQRAEARRAQKEKDAQAEEDARAARAPTGFVRSMRFFSLVLSGLILLVVTGVQLLEDDALVPWPVVGGVTLVWFALFALAALDAATWRRRLSFELRGFDAIAGKDSSGDDRAPWVAVNVRIDLRTPSSDALVARKRALELLAARANEMLHKDRDLKDLKGRTWKVDGDSCAGETTLALYTTRVLETWLRKDVSLLASLSPVVAVVVKARYTGKSSSLGAT